MKEGPPHPRQAALDAGHEVIFVERVKNEYSDEAWCVHRPWLIVTTTKGRVKIGWRKRVISIDWSDSPIEVDGSVAFKDEGVTAMPREVHADDYEAATRYLKVLLS